jgi:hypothetical protein
MIIIHFDSEERIVKWLVIFHNSFVLNQWWLLMILNYLNALQSPLNSGGDFSNKSNTLFILKYILIII